MHSERTHHFRRGLGLVLFTISSILAGIFGGLISQNLIGIEDIQQFTKDQPRAIVLEDKTRSAGSDDPARLAQEYAHSIVTIYQVPRRDRSNGSALLDSWVVGSGVAVTSDGWLATVAGIPEQSIDLLVVDAQRRVYEVAQKESDPATGVIFLKVAAQGWRPVQFVQDGGGYSYRKAYTVTRAGSLRELTVTSPQYFATSAVGDLVQSSDILEKRLNVSDVFSEKGQPVFTQSREVLGLTEGRGILPAHYIRDALTSLLKNQKIQRTAFSFIYRDLSRVLLIEKKETDRGARIVAPATLRVKTPRGEERLSAGDTIVRINDEIIDGNRSFSEVVNQYKPGDTVDITIIQKGTEKEFSIILP
jgi:hypothetical protein